MKNLKITRSLLFFFLLTVTFVNAQYDEITIIEKSLAVKDLKKYLQKDEMGKLLPPIIVTNSRFSEYLDIDFEGKKVALFENNKDTDLREDEAFIEVTSFKIRNNTSILKFKYDGRKVKIKLRKVGKNWEFKSFFIRGKKHFYSHHE